MIVAGLEFTRHDFVALFAQGFTSLGAGVVEFAGLTNDDRAGTNDQDFPDVVSPWHDRSPSPSELYSGATVIG